MLDAASDKYLLTSPMKAVGITWLYETVRRTGRDARRRVLANEAHLVLKVLIFIVFYTQTLNEIIRLCKITIHFGPRGEREAGEESQYACVGTHRD